MSAVAFPVTPLVSSMDQKLIASVKDKPALLRGTLKTVAEAVLDYIVSRWPVDTAKSLAGWGVRRGGGSWEVYNAVEYTSFVHEGLAESLFNDALGRAASGANRVLRDRIKRSQTARGKLLRRRAITQKELGRSGRATRRVIGDAAARTAARRSVATFVPTRTLTAALISQVRKLVNQGRIEAAVALLVKNGQRNAARKLAKAIQPS